MTCVFSCEGIEGRILESLGWGVFVVGRESRRVNIWNRRMEELTGIAADAVRGRPVAGPPMPAAMSAA